MIESFSSQIKAAVRVRPIQACDYKLSRQKGIQCEECLTPKSDGETIALVKDAYHSKDFHFNQVFGHLETQKDVYEKGCQQLVNDFTNGYNACLLCYGQSGTGKTYTMFGNNPKNWSTKDNITGVMQHSLTDIFSYIDNCRENNKTAKLYVSFYEIYLESVRDLLIPCKVRGQKVNLNIRECPERGTYIEGLSIFEVEDFDSMFELIHKAVARRVTGDQKMNATSSRSHAIVRLVLEHEVDSTEDDADSIHSFDENPILKVIEGKGKVRKNIFTFGDLAGSERLSKSGSSGKKVKEAQNINKSISALGNCVQALAFASNKREKGGITASHIPFRDSKLTRLLADALSGNTKTYFISTVGPAMHSYTETLSTLTFASRAASVKKIVIKEKASKDVFMDLSREMFDWQWPAVYKKKEAKQKTPIDDTPWAYDTTEDELGKSQLSPKTLSMNDFLSKSVPEPVAIITPKENSQEHKLEPMDIKIYQNDIHDSVSEGGNSIYHGTSPTTHWSPSYSPHADNKMQRSMTPEELGNNSLLFQLASEFKDFNSVYQPNSPRDYHEEEKSWTDGEEKNEASGNFLNQNLYLSFPSPETIAPVSMRKAPPIPSRNNEVIRYEAENPAPPLLKSALKSPQPPGTVPSDSNIIDELNTLSGDIQLLRKKFTEIESHDSTTSASAIRKVNEVKETCIDDQDTDAVNLTSDQPSSRSNQDPINTTVDDNNQTSDTDESLPSQEDFKDNILFTVDGSGSSPLQNLESSIISCGGGGADNDDDDFVPRDHTLLQDFSIQDFNDELDKINLENGLNLPPPPPPPASGTPQATTTPFKNKKKKTIRFDLKSVPGYDSSEIIDVSLNASSIKRNCLPPPPSTPHPNTLLPCDKCDALKNQVLLLQSKLQEQNDEIYFLKEFIHLNNLQIPAVSVKDDSSGAFF